jgi:hypothetical protein
VTNEMVMPIQIVLKVPCTTGAVERLNLEQ